MINQVFSNFQNKKIRNHFLKKKNLKSSVKSDNIFT